MTTLMIAHITPPAKEVASSEHYETFGTMESDMKGFVTALQFKARAAIRIRDFMPTEGDGICAFLAQNADGSILTWQSKINRHAYVTGGLESVELAKILQAKFHPINVKKSKTKKVDSDVDKKRPIKPTFDA